jgi:hypothetical protein
MPKTAALRSPLTAERARDLLSYDPETGHFTRLRGRCKGKLADFQHPTGYILVSADGVTHRAHRLA